MTPQEIRTSILQLAVQGKLVEQRPEEGTGLAFYKTVQTAKQDLIRANQIKRPKPLAAILEDEIPFDIPETWCWVRFGDFANYNIGKTPPRAEPQWWKSEVPWVSISDMPQSGHVSSTKEAVSKKTLSEKFGDKIVPAGTLLMSFKLTIGKMAVLDMDAVHNEAIISIFPFADENDTVRDYLFWALPLFAQNGDSKNAIKGKTLNSKSISNILLPIPPLAEQKRIVTKIEELMPLVDKYEEVWDCLDELNNKFPEDLQKSILQYAFQGRLVEQDLKDGTGKDLYQHIQKEKEKLIKEGIIRKEKPLPQIAEDDIPFDIPESWKWTYIGEIFQHNTGKALNSSDRIGSPLEYITTSNVYWNRFELKNLKTMLFSDSEIEKCTISKGDLLVLEGGDIGRAAIWNYEYPMRIQNHIHRLRPYGNVSIEFFYYLFFLYKNSGLINGKGIGIKGLSAKVLHSLIVPLPPLAEQKRIVAKIEELLPLCENLQ